MAAVACSSFFPMLFRYQEHAVIVLVVLSLGMCAIERVSPWIKNPLDLPLWLFMIWVLCTVPFATDSAYSFAEWKKCWRSTLTGTPPWIAALRFP